MLAIGNKAKVNYPHFQPFGKFPDNQTSIGDSRMKFYFSSVIVVLSVWCFPFQAIAECTWVLWQYYLDSSPATDYEKQSWEFKSAYNTRTECITRQEQEWRDTIKHYNICGKEIKCFVESVPYKISVSYNSAPMEKPYVAEKDIRNVMREMMSATPPRSEHYELFCVPDTIDPKMLKR